MPLILLVRHGQASFGAADYDRLSPLGVRQAELVGAELARRGVRDPHVVHGGLRRQRDTALALHHPCGTGAAEGGEPPVPQVDPRWQEYDHQGLVARYGAAELAGADPGDSRAFQRGMDVALHRWVTEDPEGEWSAFRDGAADALESLRETAVDGRDVVVVTSGGVISAVAQHLLSLPPAGVIAVNRTVVNTSITSLLVGRSGLNLLSLNDHAHLLGQDRSLLTYR